MQMVRWLAVAWQVREERERVMCGIEQVAELMRKRGDVEAWFKGCDAAIRKVGRFHIQVATAYGWRRLRYVQVSGQAHGPLLEKLAATVGYHDVGSVELLRKGGCLAGVLFQ